MPRALLEAGCALIQRWYADVPWGTPLWRATQLLSLHKIMDRPGEIERDNNIPLAARAMWGTSEPLKPEELRSALARLAALSGLQPTTALQPAGPSISADDLQVALKAVSAAWISAAHDARFADPMKVTAGEFAVIASRLLLLPDSK